MSVVGRSLRRMRWTRAVPSSWRRYWSGGRAPRKRVRIVEVGPRDGLQNERVITTGDKVRLIEQLAVGAGLRTVEVGSFVSAKRVPQMADTGELWRQLQGVLPSKVLERMQLPVLVPNERHLERALEVGCREVAVFVSAFAARRAGVPANSGAARTAAAAGARVRIVCIRVPIRRAGEAGGRGAGGAAASANGLLRSVAGRHHRRRHAGQRDAPAGHAARGRCRHCPSVRRHCGGGQCSGRFGRLPVRARLVGQRGHRRRGVHAARHERAGGAGGFERTRAHWCLGERAVWARHSFAGGTSDDVAQCGGHAASRSFTLKETGRGACASRGGDVEREPRSLTMTTRVLLTCKRITMYSEGA
eukprot:ctg_12.g11